MTAKSNTAETSAPARSTHHDTFVIDRVYDASPARVYAAWADPAAKGRWFSAPSDKWKQLVRESDFRVGGRDRLKGAWNSGPVSDFQCLYHDIVPEQRIVYSYDMYIDERRISISLATIEFQPAGKGTRMIVTEQGVFLDGYDDAGSRERGTRALMDGLAAALQA